jgi:hypothetical protein
MTIARPTMMLRCHSWRSSSKALTMRLYMKVTIRTRYPLIPAPDQVGG